MSANITAKACTFSFTDGYALWIYTVNPNVIYCKMKNKKDVVNDICVYITISDVLWEVIG